MTPEIFDGAGEVEIVVNGRTERRRTDVQVTLQEFLHRALHCRDVRKGCGEGVCGACTVLLDGRPVASCLLLAVQAHRRTVVTATGLATAWPSGGGAFRRLTDNLLANDAFQCGYCACGMLVSGMHHVQTSGRSDDQAIRQALAGNLCRCTGYQQIVDAVAATASGQTIPPGDYPREDLKERLDATVRYPTDDLDAPPTASAPLIGRVLWSEHAHARVHSIDVTGALAIDGVVTVLTARHLPHKNVSGNAVFRSDQPILVREGDEVRSPGDALAVVAATSDVAARAAVRAITVVYTELAPVTDPDAPGAVEATRPFTQRRGNVGAPFAAAESGRDPDLAVVSGEYGVRANDHACMELEGGQGWWEGGDLVLSVPTQTPHTVRRYVADALGHPERHVRVVAPRMGGSFGKYLMTNLEGLLALLVWHTRQHVRLVLDRGEMLARSAKRHPLRGRYAMVVRRSTSEIVALKAELTTDAGAYVGITPTVAALFAVEATGAYEIAHVEVSARSRVTNNLIGAPMRGYGSQQVSFGIESLVEKAARQVLKVSSLDFRLKNLVRTHVDGTGEPRPDPTTHEYLTRCLTTVRDRLGPPPAAGAVPEGWRLGRGLAPVHAKYGYPYGVTDQFVVKIRLDAHGDFFVESDLGDAGSGIAAGLTHLVARALALPRPPAYVVSQAALDDPTGHLFVHGRRLGGIGPIVPVDGEWLFRTIEAAQTSGTAWLAANNAATLPSVPWFLNRGNTTLSALKARLFPHSVDAFIPRVGGSRSLLMAGLAAQNAVHEFLTTVAGALRVDRHRLHPRPTGLFVSTPTSRELTWGELALNVCPGGVSAVGRSRLPEGQFLHGSNQVGPIDYMNGAHGVDLCVHPATGQVQVLRYIACHDVGRIHDRGVIEGQIIGGILMGYGQAIMEHLRVERGEVRTTKLHEYHVASALDGPQRIELELLESGSGRGPNGAKGIGEAAAVAAPCAIANALYDALGRQLTAVTATPEDIAGLT